MVGVPQGGRNISTEVADGPIKKSVARSSPASVLKPTQVGEAKSLRRASDLSLRNSAKCPRNFGRRGPRGDCRGEHKADPSDCLPQTQVPAKS